MPSISTPYARVTCACVDMGSIRHYRHPHSHFADAVRLSLVKMTSDAQVELKVDISSKITTIWR